LKNTLDRAKTEIAAAKAAQDEAINKSKTAKKAAPIETPVKKDEQESGRATEGAWPFRHAR
jgi:hypothetical protein